MKEIWKPYPGDDWYDVSSLGRVRSWVSPGPRGHRRADPKILSQVLYGPSGKDYYGVVIRGGLQRKIHLMVLETFTGPRPEGAQGCHNNGDRFDNRRENLRWGTPGSNNRDKRTHGTDHQVVKTHCPRGHEYTPENTYGGADSTHRRCKTCAREKARSQGAPKTPRTHCRKGHELTPENTWASGGQRKCRTCAIARRRAHRSTPPSE